MLLAKKLEQRLSKYFDSLEKAFPYSQIDKFYNKYVQESEGSDREAMIAVLVATFSASLSALLIEHTTEAYMLGTIEVYGWVGVADTPPISRAVDWAKAHVSKAKLVDGINKETTSRLSNVISNGIKNKRGIPGIKSDIRHEFNWMARGAPSDIKGLTLASRAELIAKTETRKALFQASHDSMIDMGIDGKEWVLGSGGETGNCEDCIANAAVGIIPVNKDFPTPEGDIHPGCTCAIAPARLSRK